VSPGGKALALAVPESLFASEDGGATWKRAAEPPAGLFRVGALPDGELLAQGIFSSLAWEPKRPTPFARVQAMLPPQAEVEVEVGRAPTASAVRAGRAAIAGDRYYEAIRPDDPGGPWLLAAGSLEGPLATRPIPGTTDCGSIKLGAGGRHLAAACVRPVGDAVIAEVLRSHDAGARWAPAARIETPHVDGLAIAVSLDGAVLITGACKPEPSPGAAAAGSLHDPIEQLADAPPIRRDPVDD
jgi:hypothetical protein